jgi:hypothetical protein
MKGFFLFSFSFAFIALFVANGFNNNNKKKVTGLQSLLFFLFFHSPPPQLFFGGDWVEQKMDIKLKRNEFKALTKL